MAFNDLHKHVFSEATTAERIWTPTNGKQYMINSYHAPSDIFNPGRSSSESVLPSRTYIRVGTNNSTQRGYLTPSCIGLVIKGEGNTYPRMERGDSNNTNNDAPTVVNFIEVTTAQNYETKYIAGTSNTFTPASGEKWAIKAWLAFPGYHSNVSDYPSGLTVRIGNKYVAINNTSSLTNLQLYHHSFWRGFILDDTMRLESGIGSYYWITLQKVAR